MQLNCETAQPERCYLSPVRLNAMENDMELFHHYLELFYLGTPTKMFVYRYMITFHTLCVVYYVVGQQEKESKFGEIVKRTVIATAHTCMDHVNATTHDLESLRDEPPYPEKSACIVKCLLEKIGVVKGNKYSKTGFMTAVTPLVFTNRKKMEHMKTVSENCDREVNHKQETPCQLGNEVTTCIFKYAPELHFKS